MKVHHIYRSLFPSLALLSGLVLAQDESCEFHNYTQKVDHFGSHNGTFQQQYSLFTDFFKPGGPIMFFQGEESTVLDCANTTIMYEWAKELNGMAVSLEHRYFGKSKPFGPESSTLDNLKYLTLDNVMLDAKEFTKWLRTEVEGAEKSRVIVASGSYGGYLAGAFRLNHPEAFYGALASAGPVMGFGNASHPDSYNWWNWVNRVYRDASLEASDKIKAAFDTLLKRGISNDTASLQQDLNLCTPVSPGNLTQLGSLLGIFPTIFMIAAEFNYPFANAGRTPVALPLQKVINIAINSTEPLQILKEAANLWFKPLGEKCTDYEDPKFIYKGVPLIEVEYFSYITCTYCPLHTTAYIANGTIFPARSPPDPTVNCRALYNITPMTAEEVNTRYHFSPADIANSTRIIWSKGQYDPTSGVEPLALPISSDPMRSRVLEATDVAHREDLFRSNPKDREGVKLLRKQELEIIRGWLQGNESA